jgi:Na+-translocating ferredoxin:NAD+ oxidoreductase RNF subunit RnfB
MQPIEPRSMVKYDTDMKIALEKMEQVRALRKLLPSIDCGACGAPSCEALAEDIVCRGASLNACIFMKTRFEKQGSITHESSVEIMEEIWGKARFSDENKSV